MATEKHDQVRQVQILGYKYADAAHNFFGANYKAQPQLGEVALFYGTAASSMVAAMYAFVHANAGKDKADEWLGQVFDMISIMVRSKGIPVAISIKAISSDVANPDKAMVAPPVEPCTCALEPSGACPTCPAGMKEAMKKTIASLSEFVRGSRHLVSDPKDRKVCKKCRSQYLDAATASVIMGGALGDVPETHEAFYDQLFGLVVRHGAAHGLEEMPLTEEAWAQAMEKIIAKRLQGGAKPPAT